MKKILKVATWIFIMLAGVFFWMGLRTTSGNLEYTLYALGMIAVAWMTNHFIKKVE